MLYLPLHAVKTTDESMMMLHVRVSKGLSCVAGSSPDWLGCMSDDRVRQVACWRLILDYVLEKHTAVCLSFSLLFCCSLLVNATSSWHPCTCMFVWQVLLSTDFDTTLTCQSLHCYADLNKHTDISTTTNTQNITDSGRCSRVRVRSSAPTHRQIRTDVVEHWSSDAN